MVGTLSMTQGSHLTGGPTVKVLLVLFSSSSSSSASSSPPFLPNIISQEKELPWRRHLDDEYKIMYARSRYWRIFVRSTSSEVVIFHLPIHIYTL